MPYKMGALPDVIQKLLANSTNIASYGTCLWNLLTDVFSG